MNLGAKEPGRSVALVLLGMCLLWASWPTLLDLADRWAHDPQYSHGYLVPLFAIFLLGRQRQALRALPFRRSWWGVWVLLAGVALNLGGSYFFVPWLCALSLVLALVGLCVLVGGWQALSLTWPALAFLLFMLPLPYRLQMALAHPLQRVATLASTYVLETLGLPAVAQGNLILLNGTRIGVVEACNGLSMLVTFFALSTALVILSQRGWVERCAILFSAIPIALAANVVRISVTAVLQDTVGGKAAGVFFHDVAGWLMMPLGLTLLGLELLVLRVLFVEARSEASEAKDPDVTGAIPGTRRPPASSRPRGPARTVAARPT